MNDDKVTSERLDIEWSVWVSCHRKCQSDELQINHRVDKKEKLESMKILSLNFIISYDKSEMKISM